MAREPADQDDANAVPEYSSGQVLAMVSANSRLYFSEIFAFRSSYSNFVKSWIGLSQTTLT
jgi:hypothetical protein